MSELNEKYFMEIFNARFPHYDNNKEKGFNDVMDAMFKFGNDEHREKIDEKLKALDPEISQFIAKITNNFLYMQLSALAVVERDTLMTGIQAAQKFINKE